MVNMLLRVAPEKRHALNDGMSTNDLYKICALNGFTANNTLEEGALQKSCEALIHDRNQFVRFYALKSVRHHKYLWRTGIINMATNDDNLEIRELAHNMLAANK